MRKSARGETFRVFAGEENELEGRPMSPAFGSWDDAVEYLNEWVAKHNWKCKSACDQYVFNVDYNHYAKRSKDGKWMMVERE